MPLNGPLRVVFLLQDLCYGGTQRQAIVLAERLDKARFRPEFWMMRDGEDLAPLAEEAGIPLRWLRRDRAVGLAGVLALRRWLRTDRPDLLLLLTVVPNIWGRIWGRLARVPVIVGTCRGGASPRRQHEWLLWPLADHVICNSSELQTRLLRRCGVPAAHVSVIENGIAESEFVDGPRTDEPVILHVGRFVPDKDHETLLAAFALLVSNRPQARLCLVGEGPLKARIRRRVDELGLASAVEFLPARRDLRPCYQRAALLALSSTREAQPNVLMEAMAAGLPIVATAVGGIPDMVDDGRNGVLVPPRRAGLLAEALKRMLDEPAERKRMGDEGRRTAQSRFDADAMARVYEYRLGQLALSCARNGR